MASHSKVSNTLTAPQRKIAAEVNRVTGRKGSMVIAKKMTQL
jgi:hypothetical protein